MKVVISRAACLWKCLFRDLPVSYPFFYLKAKCRFSFAFDLRFSRGLNISHICIVYLWERIRSQSLRWVPSLLFCVDVFGYHKLTIKRWNLYLLSIVNFFLKRTKWLGHLSIPDFQEVCTSFQLKLWYFLTTVTSCCYFCLFVNTRGNFICFSES